SSSLAADGVYLSLPSPASTVRSYRTRFTLTQRLPHTAHHFVASSSPHYTYVCVRFVPGFTVSSCCSMCESRKPALRPAGGLVSVALSLQSPAVAVSNRPALCCPYFPRACSERSS